MMGNSQTRNSARAFETTDIHTLNNYTCDYIVDAEFLRKSAFKDSSNVSISILQTLLHQCDIVMHTTACNGLYNCVFTVEAIVPGHPPIYDPPMYAAALANMIRAKGCLVKLNGSKLNISWQDQ